jgi:hypothetical protein
METIKNKKIQITVGVACVVLLFVIATTSNYNKAQSDTDKRLCNLEDKMKEIATSVITLQEGKHADDLRYTEIKVKLISIESTLTEIKNKLK